MSEYYPGAEPTPTKASMRQFLKTEALIWEEIQLKSGEWSDHYYDLRPLLLDGEKAPKIGAYIRMKMAEEGVEYSIVGGPILGAVLLAREVAGHGRAFAIRPESKGHGRHGRLVGPLDDRDSILVVDDVTTSGDTLIESVDYLIRENLNVVAVAAMIDRSDGATEQRLKEMEIPFYGLFHDAEMTTDYFA